MSETTFSTVANKKVNILLFGETGSGKSTTLNALANYFKFASFDEANQQLEQLSVVSPVQFTLPDPMTGKIKTIKMGDDDPNERFGSADSVTQGPVGYEFLISDVAVHVIDTPGMGDTRGTEKDKKNFDKIMCFVETCIELNAIIFIVDGCNSRCGRQDEFGQPGRPSNFCVEYRTQLRCPLLRQASLRARARARASDADADLKKFVAAVWSLRLIAISCGTERVCCVVRGNSLQSEQHPTSHC